MKIWSQRRITPTSRFLCFWHFTVASFPFLSCAPIHETARISNGCRCTIRHQTTAVVRTGFEPVRWVFFFIAEGLMYTNPRCVELPHVCKSCFNLKTNKYASTIPPSHQMLSFQLSTGHRLTCGTDIITHLL